MKQWSRSCCKRSWGGTKGCCIFGETMDDDNLGGWKHAKEWRVIILWDDKVGRVDTKTVKLKETKFCSGSFTCWLRLKANHIDL